MTKCSTLWETWTTWKLSRKRRNQRNSDIDHTIYYIRYDTMIQYIRFEFTRPVNELSEDVSKSQARKNYYVWEREEEKRTHPKMQNRCFRDGKNEKKEKWDILVFGHSISPLRWFGIVLSHEEWKNNSQHADTWHTENVCEEQVWSAVERRASI